MIETVVWCVIGGACFVFGSWFGRRITLNEWRVGALGSNTICEWSEIEGGSGIYNTCRPGEEFHLAEGLELWPHCHFCGRGIEVVDSENSGG